MILNQFLNKHPGSRAVIVGKGPSLDKLGELLHLEDDDIVYAVNEAIHKVESTFDSARRAIYAVQQDRDLQFRCTPKNAIHFISRHAKAYAGNTAVVYDTKKKDLVGVNGHSYTAAVAAKLALFMGCDRFLFVAFDSWEDPKLDGYAKCIGVPPQSLGFASHRAEIIQACNGMPVRVVGPTQTWSVQS